MSRFKNLAMLLTPALLVLALTAFADDKKPDDKKPDVKKPEDKKPDDKKPDDKKPDDKKPEAGVIVIIDSKGKENKVKTWEIVGGTRRLGWLAPPLPEEKPE